MRDKAVATRLYINTPNTMSTGLRRYSGWVLTLELGFIFICVAVNVTKHPLTPINTFNTGVRLYCVQKFSTCIGETTSYM